MAGDVPAQVTVGDGQPYSGCAADVWSSGCVLCAAALFALPFGKHHHTYHQTQPRTPLTAHDGFAPKDARVLGCLAKGGSESLESRRISDKSSEEEARLSAVRKETD